ISCRLRAMELGRVLRFAPGALLVWMGVRGIVRRKIQIVNRRGYFESTSRDIVGKDAVQIGISFIVAGIALGIVADLYQPPPRHSHRISQPAPADTSGGTQP